MKTDDLIKTLAQDATPPTPLWRTAGKAALVAIAAASLLFWAAVGVRPDIDAALSTWRFNLKVGLVAIALGLMAWEFMRLMRPVAKPRVLPTAVIAAVLAAAVAVEMIVLPAERWTSAATGGNWIGCLTTIPFLSAIPLAATMWAMRSGAPTAPAAAGAVAGGASAALGAFLYAWHCPSDSPLFVALWYPLATAVVVAMGAVAGRLTLRW